MYLFSLSHRNLLTYTAIWHLIKVRLWVCKLTRWRIQKLWLNKEILVKRLRRWSRLFFHHFLVVFTPLWTLCQQVLATPFKLDLLFIGWFLSVTKSYDSRVWCTSIRWNCVLICSNTRWNNRLMCASFRWNWRLIE